MNGEWSRWQMVAAGLKASMTVFLGSVPLEMTLADRDLPRYDVVCMTANGPQVLAGEPSADPKWDADPKWNVGGYPPDILAVIYVPPRRTALKRRFVGRWA